MTTYTDLVADIKSYTENDSTEFSDEIPTFILNAETRIKRKVDSDFFRKVATATMTASDPFLSAPTDMIVDRWMKIKVSGSWVDLRAKEKGFLMTFWPDDTSTGQPRLYANWGQDQFRLAPVPDSNYTTKLSYTYRPTILSTSNESNYISTDMGDALLYACLVEAYGFMKATDPSDGDIKHWNDRYNETMDAIIMEEEKRKREEEARFGELK